MLSQYRIDVGDTHLLGHSVAILRFHILPVILGNYRFIVAAGYWGRSFAFRTGSVHDITVFGGFDINHIVVFCFYGCFNDL